MAYNHETIVSFSSFFASTQFHPNMESFERSNARESIEAKNQTQKKLEQTYQRQREIE